MVVCLTAKVRTVGYFMSKIKSKSDKDDQLTRLHECIRATTQCLKIRDLLEDSCSTMLLLQYSAVTFMLCSIVYVIPKVNI